MVYTDISDIKCLIFDMNKPQPIKDGNYSISECQCLLIIYPERTRKTPRPFETHLYELLRCLVWIMDLTVHIILKYVNMIE